MTQLSVSQVATVWTRNGGDVARVVTMTAIAIAESSGITDAASATNDFGLWQINGVHFGDGIVTADNVDDPDVNAREAIALSGNGQNVAPWATCYADIGATGWLGWLSDPQPGSAAYALIPAVQATLAVSGALGGGPSASACGPDDVGIPNSAVAGLAPGQSVWVYTCPGGPFDAGTLAPGYAVTWTVNGTTYVVTSANAGTMIPASTYVNVQRLTMVPGSGGLPGPPANNPGTPTPPPSTLPPPVTPIPVGPAPSGNAQDSLQQGWNQLNHYLNYGADAYVQRIANARTRQGDVLR